MPRRHSPRRIARHKAEILVSSERPRLALSTLRRSSRRSMYQERKGETKALPHLQLNDYPHSMPQEFLVRRPDRPQHKIVQRRKVAFDSLVHLVRPRTSDQLESNLGIVLKLRSPPGPKV